MNKTVYKIRRKSDGLYSTGGHYPSFTVKGKVWNSKSALHNHLNFNPTTTTYSYSQNPFIGAQYEKHDAYAGCELVEIEVVQTEKTSIKLDDYREQKRQADKAAAEKRGKLIASRIKKCPTCSQPLNTHLCGGK
jgi:hypothetical protein